jgi:hypothetical protein
MTLDEKIETATDEKKTEIKPGRSSGFKSISVESPAFCKDLSKIEFTLRTDSD